MIYGFILCLGDSITNGARDDYNRGFPFELSDLLWEKYEQSWICINKGVNGWTSADLLRNVYDIARSYPEAHEVTVCIGMNDSKPSVRTPTHIYIRNVKQIIRVLRALNKKVYLLTIPDLGVFGSPDYDNVSQNWVDEYNAALTDLMLKEKVWGVDLRGMPKECYADSVHLNNSGAVFMANRVLSAIEHERGFNEVKRGARHKTRDYQTCSDY